EDLTNTGDVLGTLSYMPPEQAEGSPVGPSGDVYSLALTLYEAWTGHNPRRRPTPTATIRALEADLPLLADERPDLPAPLTDLVDACLDREPEYRPLVEDLGRGLESAIPELDATVPGKKEQRSTTFAFDDTAVDLPGIAAAAGIGGMITTGMIVSGSGDPFSVAIAFIVTALVTLLNARVGFLLAGAGLTAWLAFVASMPGAALLTALVSIPAGLLIRGSGRALALASLGPLLGTLGMAPFLPLLAAATPEWRDRATVSAVGLTLTALAEAITGRALLLGKIPAAGPGWESSFTGVVTGVLIPVLTAPTFLLSLLVWVTVSVTIGAIIHRSRLRREGSSEERFEFAPVGSGRVPDAH
ncbi:MAG: protein kinase, partial [Actinomycetota bacterium]|nr:protein kinase [Actinomycetota bacterium]